MPVIDIQLWADDLEDVRIPAIESDISDNTSEINARAQELSDALAANVAATTSAQQTANTADSLATNTYNQFVALEVSLKAYADASAQTVRDNFQQTIDTNNAAWQSAVQANLQSVIDAALPDLIAENNTTISEIETLLSSITTIAGSYDVSVADLLTVTIPALAGDVTAAQNDVNTVADDVTLIMGTFPSHLVNMYTDHQLFGYNEVGVTPSPATATLTATTLGFADAYYDFSIGGTSLQNDQTGIFTYTPTADSENMPQTVRVSVREASDTGSVLAVDFTTLHGYNAGSTIPFILLSNEAHGIPSNADGTSPDLTGASTTVKVMIGSVDDTSNWTLSRANSAGVSSTLSASTITVTAMSNDSAYVDITATRTGYATLVRRFSLGKQKVGAQGISGRSITDVNKAGSTVTVTYDSGIPNTFTVNGVASASKVGDVLTITYDNGQTSTLTDGGEGRGISDITRSGDIVTVLYDDGNSATYSVTDGDDGVDAVVGRIEFVTVSNIEKDSAGGYSASYISFDAIFEQSGVKVAQDRYSIFRSGDTWNSFADISGGSQLNQSRLTEVGGLSAVGINATGKITYSYDGITSSVSASVAILKQGLGITDVDKSGKNVTVTYDNGDTDVFEVNGVSNASKAGGVLTITYDDGTTQQLVDGDPGVGITSVERVGDIVTVVYDDTSSSTYPVTDGVDAIYGDADPVGAMTITVDTNGTYSESYLDFDIEFRQNSTLVAADRYRITRNGAGWASVPTKPAGGSEIDVGSMTGTTSNVGKSGSLIVTHTSGGKVTVPVSIISDGVPGVSALDVSVSAVSASTITKDAAGVYSASYLDFDVEFLREGVVVSADRFRATRSGDTWSTTVGLPAGGVSEDTSSLSRTLTVNGQNASLIITNTDFGTKTTIPVSLIIEGSNGAKGDTGDALYTGRVYFNILRTSAPSPSSPTGSSYDTVSGLFGTLTSSWVYDPPDVDGTDTDLKLWSSRYTVLVDGETGAQTISFRPATGAIIFANDVQSDNYNGDGTILGAKGTDGWFIGRTNGYAEFGSASIRDKLDVSQLKIDDTVTFDTDGSGNLIIKANGIKTVSLDDGAVETDKIAIDAVSGALVDDTGYLDGPQTGGEMCTLDFVVDDVKEVTLAWYLDQRYAPSASARDWGFSLRKNGVEIDGRNDPLMELGTDFVNGVFVDKAPGTGTKTYSLHWWSNDATLDAYGYLAVTGARKK